MKKAITILFFALLLISCNNKKNTSENFEENQASSKENISTAEKIANANGYENWKDVSEIAFTFNVVRDKNHFERTWIWKPNTGAVTMISEKDTVQYNRSKIDSLVMKTDGDFINDKYWLLAPFQLVWDAGTTFSETKNALAPISKDTLNQLTIIYGNEGGYTPGDAYDFFYDTNFKIKEWNYRKSNAIKPSLSTTWEDYENFGGIEIAKMHKDSTGSFNIYFTNISIRK